MFHLGSAYENDGSTMARSKEDEVANEKEDGSDGEERRNGPGRNNKFVKKFELQITRRKELTRQDGRGMGLRGLARGQHWSRRGPAGATGSLLKKHTTTTFST
jgi:hypothetical protein